MAMRRARNEHTGAPQAAPARHRDELAVLLRRARQRREQRGAAVFLVVMVMTIAAAIGIFSMHSASLTDLAVGYSRQSTQAALIADYAARVTANYVERNPEIAASTDHVINCAPGLSATEPCTVFMASLVEQALVDTLGTSPPGSSVYGQLGHDNTETRVDAEFVTEMTEPSMATITASPGFTAGLFRQVTFTSIARVYPTDLNDLTSTGMCSNAAHGAVSQQTVRAHVIVPL
jgi:hypothetical protein